MRETKERLEHLFEQAFLVGEEDITFLLDFTGIIPWENFLLNPRRLRGSDFLMRWSQGQWSEQSIVSALEDTGEFFAIPYGISSVAPENDPRSAEVYFEFLDRANAERTKRPDLLVFPKRAQRQISSLLNELAATTPPEGVADMEWQDANSFFAELSPTQRLPFFREDHPIIRALLREALLGVEAENSLWITEKMPGFHENLRPMRRLDGKPGLPKNTVAPTIIIKKEDIEPLRAWEKNNSVPIHIWHIFFDRAFGISLTKALSLIKNGYIDGTLQSFQAPGGATTTKTIYKIYHHHAYPLATTVEQPELKADHIVDKNGHILPFVRFVGGKLQIAPEALDELRGLIE